MNLPKLFKKSSTGASQEWEISVEPVEGEQGAVIVTKWGQVGGATQESRDFVEYGKNVGKKNETSALEQAESEAKSQWEKKLKKGYVQSSEAADRGEVDAVITGGISPMLAQGFDKHGHKLAYYCYSQPKLDGHRCLAVVDSAGKCTLWSRTRKSILSMPHIVAAVEVLDLYDVTMDGELYNHDYRDKFEQLTSFIRDSEAKPGSEIVQYHVYDLPSSGFNFEGRLDQLCTIFDSVSYDDSPLRLVETECCADEDELMASFDKFVEQGYEGAIARNADGLYVNKRSYDLLKIKEFLDAEFLVVGVEQGRGKLAGHAIFVCETMSGSKFRAKMVGLQEELKKYWDEPSLAVGKMLTVKYQGLTGKNGVPRFPVALRFREDA